MLELLDCDAVPVRAEEDFVTVYLRAVEAVFCKLRQTAAVSHRVILELLGQLEHLGRAEHGLRRRGRGEQALFSPCLAVFERFRGREGDKYAADLQNREFQALHHL